MDRSNLLAMVAFFICMMLSISTVGCSSKAEAVAETKAQIERDIPGAKIKNVRCKRDDGGWECFAVVNEEAVEYDCDYPFFVLSCEPDD